MMTHVQTPAAPRATKRPIQRAALNEDQSRLVESNIGLVYVHLKHFVPPDRFPWSVREKEDLVQEGTLGLIRAAQDFNPLGKIPFPAFALPRIHTAVRKAMLRRFGKPTDSAGVAGRVLVNSNRLHDVTQGDLDRDIGHGLLDELGDMRPECEGTIGSRLREKYERAVQRAVKSTLEDATRKGRDASLLEAVARERFLVPDSEDRTPFRAMARERKVSFARVRQVVETLREAIRRNLESDPEFDELMRAAKTEPRGHRERLSQEFEHKLARLSAAELLSRLLRSSDSQRGRLAGELLQCGGAELRTTLFFEIQKLSSSIREELLSQSLPVPTYKAETIAPGEIGPSVPSTS